MIKHIATLRNKSIGGWFFRITEYKKAKWVWLGVHSAYDCITLPAEVFIDVGKRKVANVSYRIPDYMKSIIEDMPEFDSSFVNEVKLVMLLKVDLIDLGKGTYPKIRPYAVRMSDDTLRLLEKRCWELTGDVDLSKKVWEFDVTTNPRFDVTNTDNRTHVKYAIRDGLTFVENFNADFNVENFNWDSKQQVSLHEGLRYVMTDPTHSKIARWCFGRVKFASKLKRRMIA